MTFDVRQQFPSTDADRDLPLAIGRPVTGSPFVAVPFLASAIRRRKRLVGAAALVGLLSGVIFSALSPPPHTATTTLLLIHGSQDPSHRAMATDLGLLKTTTVAQGALDLLGERSSAERLRDAYAGIPVSDDLLQVTAHGATGAVAARRADAVAKAFLDFRNQEFQRQAQLAIRSIQQRQDLLSAELTDVTTKINATPNDQRSDAAVKAFGDLLIRRTSLTDQISGLRQQIEQQGRDAAAIADQSRVIDPASPNVRATRRAIIGNVAAGLVGGLGLALGFVIVQAIASDRVRRRDDIATALGAPVGVSLGRFPAGRRAARRRFTDHLADPDRDIARLSAHLRQSLALTSGVKPALLVLSMDTDGAAAVAVAAAAAQLCAQGTKVLAVDLTLGSTLAAVLGIPADQASSFRFGDGGSPLVVAFALSESSPDNARLDRLRAGAEVVLLLGRLDPGLGAVPLVEWASAAVGFVTTGRSTGTALRSAAHMLRVAGLGFDSLVVVGVDKDDDSVGRFDLRASEPSGEAPPVWTSH